MSQVVGQTFKSRIPTLGDDASIQEALRVYHYGVDNYSTQPIPDDSIEGNFRSLDLRIDTVESSFSTVLSDYIPRESSSSNPNIIVGQTTTTIPLTIRAKVSQTSPLQQWQSSDESPSASLFTGGSFSLRGYLAVGSSTVTVSSNIAALVSIVSSSHRGIVVRSSSGQTANLQEWQNSAGTAMASVSSNGSISTNSDVTVQNNLNVSGNIVLRGQNIENSIINPLLLIGS